MNTKIKDLRNHFNNLVLVLVHFYIVECTVPTLWGSRVIGTASGSSGPMEFTFDGQAVRFSVISNYLYLFILLYNRVNALVLGTFHFRFMLAVISQQLFQKVFNNLFFKCVLYIDI